MSDHETETERDFEPKRLGGDLLASARGDAPSADMRARVAGVLGLGMGAAATVATATAKAAAAGAGAGAGASAATTASATTATTAGAATTASATTAAATTAAKIAGIGLWTKVVGVAAVTLAVGGGAVVASRSEPPVPANSNATNLATTSPATDSARARHDEIPQPEPLARAAGSGNPCDLGLATSGAPPGPAASASAAAPVAALTPSASDIATNPNASATRTVSANAAENGALAPKANAPENGVSANALARTGAAPSPLAREVRAIDTARTALAGGNARGALSALDQHDRDFPNGPMKTEADVLRVDALAASGDQAGAKRLASALLARDPSGAHARHLRAVVSSGEK